MFRNVILNTPPFGEYNTYCGTDEVLCISENTKTAFSAILQEFRSKEDVRDSRSGGRNTEENVLLVIENNLDFRTVVVEEVYPDRRSGS